MDAGDYQNSATDHYRAGEYDAAIADMNKAIELNPDDANSFALRGDIYSAKKDYDRALDDYGRSIRISPNSSAYYGKGLVYSNKGEWENAIQEYTNSIQIEPENPLIHLNYYNRGWASFKCNRITEAYVDIEKAVQLVPDDEDYLRGFEEVKRAAGGGTDETVSIDIALIQRDIKILLICSGICAVIGLIIGIINRSAFMGFWFGTGIGAALGYIRAIPGAFTSAVKEEGFGNALKSTILGLLVWLAIFMLGGPVSLLVRVLVKKHGINKIKNGNANRT